MQFKKMKILFIILLLLKLNAFAQNNCLNKISQEQKQYEFSVIFRELYYNFANMDNVPNGDIDSMYRAYIPLIMDTKDDCDYTREVYKFLMLFNNGHVSVGLPPHLKDSVANMLFTTIEREGRVFVDNVCKIYEDKIKKGDEILFINGLTIEQYKDKYLLPFASGANVTAKKRSCQIGFEGEFFTFVFDKKVLELSVKRNNRLEQVKIPFIYAQEFANDSVKMEQINEFYHAIYVGQNNTFVVDKKNDFSYIKFTDCYDDFHNFFVEKYDSIRIYNNLIIDLTDNGGGGGEYTELAQYVLLDMDSLYAVWYKSKINNSLYKAKATSRIYYSNDKDVSQEEKKLYYPYFYNNAFENIGDSIKRYENHIENSIRYKGNIYILVNNRTASAAEYFTAMLSQSPKVKVLGTQTNGCLGQPLVTKLTSGMILFINSSKTFDTKGKDISNGIMPDYYCDLEEIISIPNPKKRLKKYISIIKKIETQ